MTDTLFCPECQYDRHDLCQNVLCNCTHKAPDKELSVSHSRVESFLRCRRQEFYSYGRKLQRKDTSTALALGSAFHAVMDVLYSHVLSAGMSKQKQREAYPEAVEKALAKVDEIYEAGFVDSDKRAPLRLIIDKYLQREPFIDNAWREDDDRQWLIMAVEMEFRLEWEPGSSYPLVVDLIVKDPDGYVIVVDNKAVYDLYSYEKTELMAQIPKYIGALRALGHKIGNYGVYNMVRTRPDTKAGRPLYEWAHFLPFEISGPRVVRSFEEQITASQEVAALDELSPEERDRKAIRTDNFETCTRMCDFRELCVEELRGGSTTVLIKSIYMPKKKREVIEMTVAK